MKYSQRAKREVPVYRIVWGFKLVEARDWCHVIMDIGFKFKKYGYCYRVK